MQRDPSLFRFAIGFLHLRQKFCTTKRDGSERLVEGGVRHRGIRGKAKNQMKTIGSVRVRRAHASHVDDSLTRLFDRRQRVKVGKASDNRHEQIFDPYGLPSANKRRRTVKAGKSRSGSRWLRNRQYRIQNMDDPLRLGGTGKLVVDTNAGT